VFIGLHSSVPASRLGFCDFAFRLTQPAIAFKVSANSSSAASLVPAARPGAGQHLGDEVAQFLGRAHPAAGGPVRPNANETGGALVRLITPVYAGEEAADADKSMNILPW
jgi:hypothetical protein